jgi:hypothetical protein
VWPKSFSFIPARSEDLGVIIGEDTCRLELSDETFVTDARIVFRPHRFPSTEVELADLEMRLLDDEPVSLVLESSGFALRDGHLGAVPLTNTASLTSRYRHRVRQTEPMTLQSSGNASAVEGIVYNLSPFGFRGGPSNGREQLLLEIPTGWRATIGPLAPDLSANRELLELLGSSGRRTHSSSLTWIPQVPHQRRSMRLCSSYNTSLVSLGVATLALDSRKEPQRPAN